MSKKFSNKKNRNNPFKYGGYSMAQSYKDKITYKNKQLETKKQAMDILDMLINNGTGIDNFTTTTPMNKKTEGFYHLTVGEKFPFDLGYQGDFNKMEMLSDPTFIINMNDIQQIELEQFEHNKPIEFRVFKGSGNYEHYSFMLCKFNNVVQEFAFNPHLCKEAVQEYINKNSNIFTVVVLEGKTKVIKILRALGFDDETKANLYSLWEHILTKNISKSEYESWYHSCWKYTTEQLWDKAEPIGKWVSLY